MTLRELLATSSAATQQDRVLVALWWLEQSGNTPATAAQVAEELTHARVPNAKNWNVPARLHSAGALVDATPASKPRAWHLTKTGTSYVSALLPGGTVVMDANARSQAELRGVLLRIRDLELRSYVEEAITCIEAAALRAAAVMAWAGALATIQVEMIALGASRADPAIRRHDAKSRAISGLDDLQYVKESTLLLAAQDLNLFDKGERQMLEQCLDLRNKCGHPGRYSPGAQKVAAMVEDLTAIVYSRFPS